MQFQRLHAGFLGTRVGRQTLLHFLSAAMVPVLVSSLLGIWYVRQTLIAEATERVDRTAGAAGQIMLWQLTTLERQTAESPAEKLVEENASELTADEAAHLRKGGVLLRLTNTAVKLAAGTGTGGGMRMIRQMPDGQLRAHIVSSEEIWTALNDLIDGNRTHLCVFSMQTWQRLHCSDAMSPAEEEQLLAVAVAGRSNRTERGTNTRQSVGSGAGVAPHLLSAHRDLYLRFELASPEWRLVAAENRALALAPASSVTTSLSLLIGLAMVSAFTFAHRQIRRSTQPLEALRDATRRVEAGDLQTPVVISSRDEYGELGLAFNGMTSTLSRQLLLFRVMDDVDQATLRDREIASIASIALEGLRQLRGLRGATFAIVDERDPNTVSSWCIDAESARTSSVTGVLDASDRATMLEQPRKYDVTTAGGAAGCSVSSWMPAVNGATRIVFPLIHDGELLGAVATDFVAQIPLLDSELVDVRRIADRVVLGVANVRLLDRLHALSTGTLLAFARAIDANSPWTAGHSERVTQLACGLGRQLELTPSELSTLYRGGLMHDIGKIGIPPAVLDKAGRLDDAERALIEKHPEIGERILRPIPAFSDALGIVRSHHERFDGTGYPDRLAGENIPWLARILAVADVFDAMASDRPYRAGLTHRATITMIEGNSGTHFDPRVVAALVALDQSDPNALDQQSALRELTMQTDSIHSTPHNAMVVIR